MTERQLTQGELFPQEKPRKSDPGYSRWIYERRKARGVCVKCPKPAAPGMAQCADHIARLEAKRTATREVGLALGLCTCCGNRRDRQGRKLCSACNELRATERGARMASGLCTCGRPLDVSGKRKCAACAALECRRKNDRKAAGLCACGQAKEEDRKGCAACLTNYALHATRQREVRAEAGLCVACGKQPMRPNRLLCAPCCKKQYKASRKWRAANPDKVRAYQNACRAKRDAQIAASDKHFTGREWRDLKKAQGYACAACKRKEPTIRLTVDHVIPLSKGGGNGIDNCQALCLRCNLSKWTDTTDYRTSNQVAG